LLDYNKIQLSGAVKDIMNLEPLMDKWRAFNWNIIEIDGHDFKAIMQALDQSEKVKDRPSLILSQTIKGKGVSYMEGKWEWHGKAPNREEGEKAIQEILSQS
jgi:transketolase